MKEVRNIWEGSDYPNFGLERFLLLFLTIIPFFDLGLYWRNLFTGNSKGLTRKLGTDLYVVLNMLVPIVVLFNGWYEISWVVNACVYLSTMTLIALLSRLFLPLIPQAASNGRNFVCLILNFTQVVALFAILYMSYGKECFQIGCDGKLLNSPIMAIYLSLETFTTLGFGDITPVKNQGYVILIIQMLTSLVFINVLITSFLAVVKERTYQNRQT